MTTLSKPTTRTQFLQTIRDKLEWQLERDTYSVPPNVADYLQSEMYIPETKRPLILHGRQEAVLNEMFRREGDTFAYQTMVWSAPKKSGKTTLCAGIGLWQAERVPYGEVYVIGNDLKQADNRMAQAMRYCVGMNPRMRSWSMSRSKYLINLPNQTKIEAIPVDPAGEAGMNPTGLFWTEAWGAKSKKHQLMWTEAALSPTRMGDSFTLVESYAGHDGESPILQALYELAVLNGEALGDNLYRYQTLIVYWETERFLPWQTNATGRKYYLDQRTKLTDNEYRRVHHNEWVSSVDVFVRAEWWEACKGALPVLPDHARCVMGVDAASIHDHFAIVVLSKHERADGSYFTAVRYCRVFKPSGNGRELPFDDIEAEILRVISLYRVASMVYDEYQMVYMAQRIEAAGVTWVQKFGQGKPRIVADKRLHDSILNMQIRHDGTQTDLTEHILNANAKPESDRLRIIKRSEDKKIDAAVAASMANDAATELNIAVLETY